MEVLKVSAHSNPKSVAGALAAVVRERGSADSEERTAIKFIVEPR